MKKNTTPEQQMIREKIIKIIDNIEEIDVLTYFYLFIKKKLKIDD